MFYVGMLLLGVGLVIMHENVRTEGGRLVVVILVIVVIAVTAYHIDATYGMPSWLQ